MHIIVLRNKSTIFIIVVNDRNRNFRPKQEPKPKSFRFGSGNSYRNRNGHFTPLSNIETIDRVLLYQNDRYDVIFSPLIHGISIILHENLLNRVISLYCIENLPLLLL